ncbi:hypothetical protein CEQ90_07645 [Lewinellaceae bacterium SD302]|nr:hypothetical protein CEQ90_07645 [Lewinellaceae bacterium SD302]
MYLCGPINGWGVAAKMLLKIFEKRFKKACGNKNPAYLCSRFGSEAKNKLKIVVESDCIYR